MTPEGRGVIYVATGAAHVEAARQSAASVRASNPGLTLALFTDATGGLPEFDRIETVADPHMRSKVDTLWRTPFAETLYLDTDTRVAGDLAPAFRLLERFDLAAAHVPRWYLPGYRRQWRHEVPTAFPQHDGGVIFFRCVPKVIAFLKEWQAAYHAAGFEADQVTFRDLLWSSDLRLAVLPAEYNTRRVRPFAGWLSDRPDPVVLHLRRFHPTKRSKRKRLARKFRKTLGRYGLASD
jgi:Nucleotide-diphospho-sugar transferase